MYRSYIIIKNKKLNFYEKHKKKILIFYCNELPSFIIVIFFSYFGIICGTVFIFFIRKHAAV